MKKRLKTTEMWYYRWMLRIPWTEHANVREVLKKMATRGRAILKRGKIYFWVTL